LGGSSSVTDRLSLLLPNNWTIVKLEDIVIKFVGGGTPSKDNLAYYQGNIPWMSVKDMTSRRPQRVAEYITLEAVANSATNLIPPDTIIIATRMSLGKIVRLPFEVAINQDLKALIVNKSVDKDFLENWYIFEASNIKSLGTGTTVKGIRLEVLQQLNVPLPPLNEQCRIVAKIEALKARSQRVKEALSAIPTLLDQFRQSVLAAAFRGDLTADWREENLDVEPASVLLERIHAERRRKWEEAELQKLNTEGKTPLGDSWKSKYKEREFIESPDLPDLPNGWMWTKIEQLGLFDEQTVLTGPFGANLGREDFILEGVPVITIGCLQNRGLDLSKAMYISQVKADELERYKLRKGDFLFSRMASVGRAAIVEDELSGAIFNYHLMRLRLSEKLIKAKYFLYYVRGASAVSEYVKEVNHGATRDGINTGQLNKMPVALPPIKEQCQIIKVIENYFDRSHTIDDFILDNLEELEICNQSILAKAFRGELVPQDPKDEPASVLLDRIRAEREKLQTKIAKKSTPKTDKGRSKKSKLQDSEPVQMELGLE
jgi:type I restriction enzyme, S subunit